MKSTKLKTERRRCKRRKCHIKPIAVLGPEPVRVGHVSIISDDAAEIQFSESNGKKAQSFNELSILIPDYNRPFFSGKIEVETVSCSKVGENGNRFQSPKRKCVIAITNLDSHIRRQLKGACL
jgi:hypothetical protein